jgi:GT2 family glycosyltransferase
MEGRTKLVVVIVNYNVQYFLEQVLLSVRKAAHGLSVETWVVDNKSADNSVAMCREKFPEVKCIANTENVGFSKANNQAIRASESDYVLLLNPDTVVREDTFQKCLDFMENHPEAGALGVKTIDGSGLFLPESKRGFPSPWVAFCKAFGLSSVFPNSKLFNGYYLGHISPDQTHICDVLVGSFMFMRRTALDEVGLLDEDFFMYGEDIDLSYRIVKGGYQNYYFADTTLIHYKGESTKKGSLNYVRTFYQAMMIFARKHFKGEKATLFIGLMQAAVWFRALLTIFSQIFRNIYFFIFDALLIFGGLFWLKGFWSSYYFKDSDYITSLFLQVNTPLYIVIWLTSIYFSGGYDKPVSLRRVLRGLFLGTITISALYGFLDLDLRHSRMLIVLGALWATLALLGLRLFVHFIQNKNFKIGSEKIKKLIFIGAESEIARAKILLQNFSIQKNILGAVAPPQTAHYNAELFLGKYENLTQLVELYGIEEIIFCGKDISAHHIMDTMQQFKTNIEYRILPEGSDSIVGSNSKNSTGELYTADVRFNLAQKAQRRNKRVFDLLCALPLATVLLLKGDFRKFGQFLSILPQILSGKATLIGYNSSDQTAVQGLPPLSLGFFNVTNTRKFTNLDTATLQRLNFLYARDYTLWQDARALIQAVFY